MKIWDLLFVVFVFFPIVTGGLWFEKPGMRLEYTQPGFAAAILFLALLIARKRGVDIFQKSWLLRTTQSIWEKWESALTQNRFLALLLSWSIFTTLWYGASWSRHHHFRSGAADLGIFTNAIWNIFSFGEAFSSLKGGISLLADHQNFLIFPIGWLFPFEPNAFALLLLQSIVLCSGGVALYLLGRQRLGDAHPIVPLLPFLYWCYLPIRSANLFDFHPETFMLPLFLFGVLGLQSRTWLGKILGVLTFIAASLAKESGGPVAVGIGLAWILGSAPQEVRKQMRYVGCAVVAWGLGLFLFDTKVMPQLLKVEYVYSSVYAPFGNSLLSLAAAPFQHPFEFFQRLFGLTRWKFLLGMTLPFAFLPFLAPVALVAAIPAFLMLFLTEGTQRLSLGFHYAIEPAVGVLLALVAALGTSWALNRQKQLLFVLPWFVLFGFGRSELFHWRYYSTTPHQAWVRESVLPSLNPTAPLSASSALVPHLSTRRWVHHLPVMEMSPGNPVDCIVWERSLNNTPMTAEDEARVTEGLKSYVLELSCETLSVYRSPLKLTQGRCIPPMECRKLK